VSKNSVAVKRLSNCLSKADMSDLRRTHYVAAANFTLRTVTVSILTQSRLKLFCHQTLKIPHRMTAAVPVHFPSVQRFLNKSTTIADNL